MNLSTIIAPFASAYSPDALPNSKAQPRHLLPKSPQSAGLGVPKDSQVRQAGVIVLQNEPVEPAVSELRVPKDRETRPWLKVRLAAKDAGAVQIVARWTEQKQASSHVADAIFLFDAVLRGDLDAVREVAPLLVAALTTTSQKRTRKSDPPSESPKDSVDQNEEGNDLVAAIAEVTLCDPVVNGRSMTSLARRLRSAGYTPQDVSDWYQRCWLQDWRGKKGERPSLKDVQLLIGHVRALPPLPTASGDQTGAPENSQAVPDETHPYLADPYFQRQFEADAAAPLELAAPCPEYVGQWRRWWDATLGQLKVQLNRATYDTWLKHVTLVDVIERGTTLEFVAEVPHRYAKDWIDRHLLHSLKKTLHDLCDAPKFGRAVSAVDVLVEVADGQEPACPSVAAPPASNSFATSNPNSLQNKRGNDANTNRSPGLTPGHAPGLFAHALAERRTG